MSNHSSRGREVSNTAREAVSVRDALGTVVATLGTA